jgi:hypothetical protein
VEGCRITNDKVIISLRNGLTRITCGRVCKAIDGTILGIKMMPHGNPIAYSTTNDVLKRGLRVVFYNFFKIGHNVSISILTLSTTVKDVCSRKISSDTYAKN